MNTAPTITEAELRTVLKCRSDGVQSRLVALLIVKGAIDTRTALRTYPVSQARLYKARIELESDLLECARFAVSAANLKGEVRVSENYLPNEMPSAAQDLS